MSCGILNPQFHHRIRIIFDPVESVSQVLRYRSAAERCETLYLIGAGDRHDPRYNGPLNPGLCGPVQEGKIKAVVEKELGNEEIGPCGCLQPQIFGIHLKRRALNMTFRKGSRPDTEIIITADKFYQFIGVGKTLSRRRVTLCLFRFIAPQGQDVFYPVIPQPVQDSFEILQTRAGSGDMGHRLNAEFLLNAAHPPDCLVSRTPACTIGH